MNDADPFAGREEVLCALRDLDRELAGRRDEEWENLTLRSFLEAFGALLGSIENTYLNEGQNVPASPWTLIADSLRGARYYE